jgi:hypothetical protein
MIITPLEIAQHKDNSDKNTIRVKEQEKQYVYYSGDYYELKRYLETALKLSYAELDIKEMQKQIVDITERITNQMCVVYLEPAQRVIMMDGVVSEDLTDYYYSIIPKNINTADKDAHRLGKLHNTALSHVTFDKRFIYNTLPSYLYDIKHDGRTLTEVSYEKMFDNEWYQVYWTDSQHYRRDAMGNKSNIPDGDGGNPFGVIPFPKIRIKNSIDFWGEGQNDLINVSEQVNLLLTKLINRDIIRGEGVLFGTNLDLDKKGKRQDEVSEVRASVSHPITVEDVHDDMVQPRLEYVGTNPQIVEVKATIDWYIRLIANFKGLNPNAVLASIQDTSDFQKTMDAVNQMEIRKDDIDPCRSFEQERWEVTKTMNNTLVGTEGAEGLQNIPDGAELAVDFAEIEIHKTSEDLREEREWKLSKNLITLAEILMKENPDLTQEQAEEIITKNKAANSTLGGTTSRFELLANNNLEQTEGNT